MKPFAVEADQINDLAAGFIPLLDIGNPDLDWVSLARGMGVEAVRVADARSLEDCLASAMRRRGPFLIEAVMPA